MVLRRLDPRPHDPQPDPVDSELLEELHISLVELGVIGRHLADDVEPMEDEFAAEVIDEASLADVDRRLGYPDCE